MFLSRFKMRTRFQLGLLLILIPLVGLSVLTALTQNRAINFGQKEILGVRYNRNVIELLRLLQLHRARATAQLGFRSKEAARIRREIKLALGKGSQYHAAVGSALGIADRKDWDQLSSAWSRLARLNRTLSTAESMRLHGPLIRKCLALNERVGDVSNLVLDPDIDSYYLMDVTLLQIPELSEMLSLVRDTGHHVVLTGSLGRADLVTLSEDLLIGRRDLDKIKVALAKAFKENPATRKTVSPDGFYQQATAYLRLVRARIVDAGGAQKLSPRALTRPGDRALQSLYSLYASASREQERLLVERVAAFRTEQLASLGIVGFVIALALALQVLIIRSVLRPLAGFREKLTDLAARGGDLRHKLAYAGTDEMRDMANAINGFLDGLAEMVRKIAQEAHAVKAVAEKMEVAMVEFREVAQEQASATEESSAAIEQLISSVESIARIADNQTKQMARANEQLNDLIDSNRNADEAVGSLSRQMEDTSRQTESGITTADQLQVAMHNISENAGRVSQILSLINDVSDQTSLLALNASIEAARAGEHGRGFAVVAEEISRLADQTARNTRDIQNLLAETGTRVDEGGQRVAQSSEVFAQIAQGVSSIEEDSAAVMKAVTGITRISLTMQQRMEEVTRFATDISRATEEQAKGGGEISQSVSAISTGADRIQQGAEAIYHNGEDLARISATLSDLVGRFKT